MQNQYICVVFESWLGGRGIIIVARSMHLYSFGKLVWGEGALESFQNQCILCGLGKLIGGAGHKNHCKINAFVLFWKVGWGAGHQNHCNLNAFVWFGKVGWGGA